MLREIVAVLAVATWILTSAGTPASANLRPKPGERCGTSFPLLENLPFWDGSRAADIINIYRFTKRIGPWTEMGGYLYLTRRGELFMQLIEDHRAVAAQSLQIAGATQSSLIAGHLATGAVIAVPKNEASDLRRRLAMHSELSPCFGGPLKDEPFAVPLR